MGEYQYTPLPEMGHIRIAVIHPGKYRDKIVISLHQIPFRQDTTTIYEALSYTWGTEDDANPVVIDPDPFQALNDAKARPGSIDSAKSSVRRLFGVFDERPTLPITKNLGIALRHLRREDGPRYMWIDAICINQGSLTEKGPQVAQMSEIYRRANRVVVWLGPEENDSNRAMDILRHMGSEVEVDYAFGVITPAKECKDPELALRHKVIPLLSHEVDAIYHLLFRKWFERLWIRQEIYLANSEAIITCGPREVSWVLFRKGLYLLYNKLLPPHNHGDALHKRFALLRNLILQGSLTFLLDVRRHFGYCECTDPRDRVYAVTALLEEEHSRKAIPAPDYTKTAAGVYKEVVLRYSASKNDCNLLSNCEFDEDNMGPSWVPDWSKPFRVNQSPDVMHAAGPYGRVADLSRTDDDILGLMGVSACVVEKVHIKSTFWEAYDIRYPQQLRTYLRAFADGMADEYMTGVSMIEALARTLLHNFSSNLFFPENKHWPQLDSAVNFLEKLMADHEISQDDLVPGTAASNFLLSVFNQTIDRHLFRASNGYIGIGPSWAEPGDLICVLLGCDAPMLLRPVGGGPDDGDSKTQKYKVVSKCFVLGLSQGEAVLGPLPDHIVPQFISEDPIGIMRHAFLDTLTGRRFFRDPRLPDTFSADDDDCYRGKTVPPQMDTFAQKGVNLRWFYLV